MWKTRLALLSLVLAPLASAKRASGYVPLPALERLGRSFLFTGVAAALIMFLLALCVRGATGRWASTSQYRSFAHVGLACVLVGAGWAASDVLNEEGRNPALFGSFALTPLMAGAVLLLQPHRTVGAWIQALLFTPPFCLALVFGLSFIQESGLGVAW